MKFRKQSNKVKNQSKQNNFDNIQNIDIKFSLYNFLVKIDYNIIEISTQMECHSHFIVKKLKSFELIIFQYN